MKIERTLDDREREILNCLLHAWEENDAPLPGGISYGEAFELFERLGLDKPAKLIAWMDKMEAEFRSRKK